MGNKSCRSSPDLTHSLNNIIQETLGLVLGTWDRFIFASQMQCLYGFLLGQNRRNQNTIPSFSAVLIRSSNWCTQCSGLLQSQAVMWTAHRVFVIHLSAMQGHRGACLGLMLCASSGITPVHVPAESKQGKPWECSRDPQQLGGVTSSSPCEPSSSRAGDLGCPLLPCQQSPLAAQVVSPPYGSCIWPPWQSGHPWLRIISRYELGLSRRLCRVSYCRGNWILELLGQKDRKNWRPKWYWAILKPHMLPYIVLDSGLTPSFSQLCSKWVM